MHSQFGKLLTWTWRVNLWQGKLWHISNNKFQLIRQYNIPKKVTYWKKYQKMQNFLPLPPIRPKNQVVSKVLLFNDSPFLHFYMFNNMLKFKVFFAYFKNLPIYILKNLFLNANDVLLS